jgi:hypothetical protein
MIDGHQLGHQFQVKRINFCFSPPGVLNAGEQYGIEGLKQACARYCDIFITPQTACIILNSIEKYIHFKATKLVLTKVPQVESHSLVTDAAALTFYV